MTTEKEIKKQMTEISNRLYLELVKWLYDNHKDILREYEKTKGRIQIEFLGEEDEIYNKDFCGDGK